MKHALLRIVMRLVGLVWTGLLSDAESNTKVFVLVTFYREDMPSPDCFQNELKCWKIKWMDISGSMDEQVCQKILVKL